MKSRSSFIAYLSILFVLGTALASAQQTSAPASAAMSSGDSLFGDWEHSFKTFNAWHSKLYVVTVDHPHRRYTCHVQSANATSLTCAASRLHSARTFPADKIAAVISPGHHTPVWLYFLAFVAVGGALITGGYFLGSALWGIGVLLDLVGGLVLLASPLAAFAADDDSPDGILYQRPNTPLAVHLR